MEKLISGKSAINFKVKDIEGRLISIEHYKGKKLLLSFFRFASCPLCNLRVYYLIRNYKALTTGGLEILAFFQSPPDIIKRYVGKQNPQFPIISDPKTEIYTLYGVEKSWTGILKGFMRVGEWMEVISKGFFHFKPEEDINIMPADFLINPDQTIHTAYYGKDMGDHLPIDTIRKFIS